MKAKPSKKSGNVVVEFGGSESRFFTEELEKQSQPLFRINTILVPIDFSDCSGKALQYALPFAEQFEASIHLLCVIQSPTPIPGLMDFPPENPKTVKVFERRLADLQEEISGQVPVEATVRVGIPYNEIVEAAREWNIDLIIMSTHGHTGLKHVWLGSTTERVVQHAPCPVLVLRKGEHEFISSSTRTTRTRKAKR